MKTFDEALEIVNKSEILTTNLESAKDYLSNPKFIALIESLSSKYLAQLLVLRDLREIMILTCSQLHIVFQAGLLVGLEMEKEDAS